MSSNSDDRVIIIGAGVTGLSLAQGLKKSGVPFVIYEKYPSIETRRNWTFGIHWGVNALRELLPEKLFEQLETTQVDPHHPGEDSWYTVPLVDGQTGRLIKQLESDKFYRLRRDKVRRWLSTDIEIHWGKELQAIDYSADGRRVTVTFSDGSQDTGSLLVGCDGARSQVRTILVGQEVAAPSDVENFVTTMCYSQHTREHALYLRSAAANAHPLYQVGMHPGGYCGWMSVHSADDKDHPETWTFFHYISYRAPAVDHADLPQKEHVAYAKSLATRFADPWKSAYEWMPEDSPTAWFTRIQNWDPSLPEHAWSNHQGRVTLAGDAAHPMSFQRGQGLNNSVQDCAQVLRAVQKFWSDRLDADQRAEAISAYEAEMKARGGKEVQMSADMTLAAHDFGKMGESALMKQGMKASSDVR